MSNEIIEGKYIDQVNIKDSKKSKIMKVDQDTKHLPIESLVEGKTYQNHVRDIVKVIKIDKANKMIKFKNISQSSNQYTEFRHINIVKQF